MNKNNSKKFALPAIILSTALAQGCATTTKNDIDHILELPPENVTSNEYYADKLHDELLMEQAEKDGVISLPSVQKETKSSKKVENIVSEPENTDNLFGVVKVDDIIKDLHLSKNSDKSDARFNVSANGGKLTLLDGNNRYKAGVEYSERFGPIASLEYGYFDGQWGTLATVKVGSGKKSFLLSGMYQGTDWGVKASVGALFQKFEGKTINQNFAGLEVIRDLSKYIEGFALKGYVNATHTEDKLLSIVDVSRKVAGGTEITTTTTEFKGGTNIGAGVGAEYNINDNNKIYGNVGYNTMGGADYGLGYEYRQNEFKSGFEYNSMKTPQFAVDTYAAKVAYIVQPGLSVELTGKLIDSSTLDDKQIGLNINYTPGLKTYGKTTSTFNLDNLSHAIGAQKAMDTLYGHKKVTTEKRFIADPVLDTTAPVLSSTNQTFTTIVGTALTLATVTANDVVDGAVKVTQTGTVNFNVAGTYNIVYSATDAAGNSSSITHTYVVNAAPVLDTTAPVLSSTNQTFTTTVGTALTLATVTANDVVDGSVTVTQTGTVDFNTVGTYTVTYSATDAASNSSSITHTYVVNAAPVLDTTAPVLSSTNQTFTTTVGTALTLATVTANDVVDGAVTVTQTGTVDFNTVGTYIVTYTATDAASNSSSITHTYVVNAIPNTAPTASDGSTDLGYLGFTYNGDLASYISDNESSDNQLTINVVSGPSHGTLVWNGTQFTYQATYGSGYFGNDSFTYNVTDPQGLTSSTQTFTIYNIIEF